MLPISVLVPTSPNVDVGPIGVAETPGVNVEEEKREGEIEGEELVVDPPPRISREGVG